MVDQLYLVIQSCNCRCGNKWTHSYPICAGTDGSLGGTPTPEQEYKLPVVAIDAQDIHFDHCYRCVSIAIPRAFQFKPAGLEGKHKARATVADLLT
jgi:hypothetical protein